MSANTPVCELTGARAPSFRPNARPQLPAAPVGTATATRQYVHAIEGASPNPRGCLVLDTRKTIPGLRLAQKYAVRVGGGTTSAGALGRCPDQGEPHRRGRRRGAALRRAEDLHAGVPIQVEVETLDQLREALAHGATSGCGNFTLDGMRGAVAVAEGRALLEVSGASRSTALREIASTGVDRISWLADERRSRGRFLDAGGVAAALALLP